MKFTPTADFSRVWIENVQPSVNGGAFAIKRSVGESVNVTADVFTDGHDPLFVLIRYRRAGGEIWHEVPMVAIGNDRFSGSFLITEAENYFYRVAAWIDTWSGWTDGIRKKFAAGYDLTNDLIEGGDFLNDCAVEASKTCQMEEEREAIQAVNGLARELVSLNNPAALVERAAALKDLICHLQPRRQYAQFPKTLMVQVDRFRARCGAWYEFFPRSTENDGVTHGSFRSSEKFLDHVAGMGFDVIYLPPIHPIGFTKRKGKNNSLECDTQDVGSPWAIGNRGGGHKAIEPALGSEEDFRKFVTSARERGLEVALDLAFQCSPDHPYLAEHPEWFKQRPDGSIHYAENPPKKYEDIVPFNFENPDWRGLWNELYSVVQHWVSLGVRIFRVDNPHTKPLRFWEWLLQETRCAHPDVIFLSEAFTRPAVKYCLAKIGFHQSYTYFTWRNGKQELTDYLRELTTTDVSEFFRPNFFANTPDILHHFLQNGGKPAFEIRLILAATLSANYGIYSGYEICENSGMPNSEEYRDSEKYQLKARDWQSPSSIIPLITRINEIRREHVSLQETNNLLFCECADENLIAFLKLAQDDVVLVVVNLDPFAVHEGMVTLAIPGLPETFTVKDLLTGQSYNWNPSANYVRLDPRIATAHVFHLQVKLSIENSLSSRLQSQHFTH